MNKEIEIIQNLAKELEKLEQDEQYLFESLNNKTKNEIEELINEYNYVISDASSKKIQPINLLRFDILNLLKEGIKISAETVNDIKTKIIEKDLKYFRKYGDAFVNALMNFPWKKKSPFSNWKKNFFIFFPFFYTKRTREAINSTLNKIEVELREKLELKKYRSHFVDFYGPQNYAASYCWIAYFPENKISHKKAYQLFVEISSDKFKAGIYAGSDIKEKDSISIEDFKTIEDVIEKLKASKELVEEKNKALINYWKFAPGEGGIYWDEFFKESIIAIGWELSDLRSYTTERIAGELGIEEPDNSKTIQEIENFRDASIGDIVIANKGKSKSLGIGVITGEYEYKPERTRYKHIREVKWLINQLVDFEKNIFGPDTFSPIRNWDIVKEKYIQINPQFEKIFNELDSKKQTFPIPETKQKVEEVGIEPYSIFTDPDKPFLEEDEINEIINSLEVKKNIVLQGPPGVGKTFIAKKIAYEMMKKTDDTKIRMIQFHQSYSYEDFIQGIRPSEKSFKVKNGIFYDFCNKAKSEPDQKFFFIIDEINRGNLSKIFGELMLLIEADKRGKCSIPLTYSEKEDDLFSVPENLYIIGTMNTADRSLAIVDYALRRRFRFITLKPKFNNRFKDFLISKGLSKDFVQKLTSKIDSLNEKIKLDKNLGEGFLIGHSFFCNVNTQDERWWFENIIKFEIKPLLEEYWFDDYQKVENEVNQLLS